MTLQQCRYVLEIANCQSVSKAVNALYVTQLSLSRAVGELETELGTVLFERTNRGARLMPEGGEFLFCARMRLAQEEALRYRFRQEQKKDPEFPWRPSISGLWPRPLPV